MPILSYQNVTKQFIPDSYGLLNVSFDVEPGEMIVITGHTGSGKTTLMKLLTREYTVTEGEIYFNQTPVHALKTNIVHLHRRQIGVVYQDYRLIKEMTVWENVALPLYIAGKKEAEVEQRVSDLLSLVKLADKYELFPTQLSGGEAQRISIARSLALAPELIFADEPTGNLDSEASKQIALLLSKINELGTTVLLSTHDLSLLDIFDNERHITLEKGAIKNDTGKQSTKAAEPTTASSMGIPMPISELTTDEAHSVDKEESTLESDLDASEKTEDPQPKKRFWHSLSLNKKNKKSSKHKKETD